MNYTYMKGCALCMTLCLTSAALPGRANAESSAIVNEVLQSSVVKGVVKDSNGEPLLGVNVRSYLAANRSAAFYAAVI